MPYRKNYGRKPTYRRRTYRRKKTTGGWISTARKAYRMARFVKSIVNTEYKFNDVTIGTVLDNAGWNIVTLNSIAQGDDNNMRNGKSILAKSNQFRLRFSLAGNLGVATVRVMLLRYNSCNGALPVMSEILVNTTSIQSFRNLNGPVGNYTVLMDKHFIIDKDFKDYYELEKYRKLQDHIKYVGTLANTASLGNHSYFLMFLSDNPSSGTDYVYVAGYNRLRYIDN